MSTFSGGKSRIKAFNDVDEVQLALLTAVAAQVAWIFAANFRFFFHFHRYFGPFISLTSMLASASKRAHFFSERMRFCELQIIAPLCLMLHRLKGDSEGR